MMVHATPDLEDAPALVVFGRDEAGKPHASSFRQGEASLAEKAADLMNMRLLSVRTDTERALAAKVPKGRLFASGKAFLPFVKASLFMELQTAALNKGIRPLNLPTGPTGGDAVGSTPTAPEPTPAAPAKPPKGKGTSPVKQPIGWADIEVGATVLAMWDPDSEWYECVVLATHEGDLFTLRWRYSPELPTFARRRVQLGLMHPAFPLAAA